MPGSDASANNITFFSKQPPPHPPTPPHPHHHHHHHHHHHQGYVIHIEMSRISHHYNLWKLLMNMCKVHVLLPSVVVLHITFINILHDYITGTPLAYVTEHSARPMGNIIYQTQTTYIVFIQEHWLRMCLIVIFIVIFTIFTWIVNIEMYLYVIEIIHDWSRSFNKSYRYIIRSIITRYLI